MRVSYANQRQPVARAELHRRAGGSGNWRSRSKNVRVYTTRNDRDDGSSHNDLRRRNNPLDNILKVNKILQNDNKSVFEYIIEEYAESTTVNYRL